MNPVNRKNHSGESFSPWPRIADLMRLEGLTAKGIAEIAGVVPSAVAKWKTGGAIGPDKLRRIADHFGERVTVDWLLGRTDEGGPDAPRATQGHAPRSREGEAPAEPSSLPPPACRLPADCDLPARLSAIEADLSDLRSKLDTLCALLGGALQAGLEKKERAG